MAGKGHGEYLGNQLLMVMSAIQFGKNFMHDGQPYRVEDGRVLRIISGNALMIVNMKPYRLSAGTMLVFPPDSIMEIEEKDKEFDFQIFSFRDLPDEVVFKECTVFHLSEDDWNLMGEYFQLLRHVLNRQPQSLKAIRSLQSSLMSELQNIIKKETCHGTNDQIVHQHSLLARRDGSAGRVRRDVVLESENEIGQLLLLERE